MMARVESDTENENSDNGEPQDVEGTVLQMHASDTSDDDSSSSSDDENENQLEEKASQLEEKIKTNPYVYDDHVNLLTVLTKIKDVTRLRHAYERLSSMCPMASSQWLSWLEFEAKHVSTLDDRQRLRGLFDRAFLDCYSPNIYVEWCTVSLSNGKEEEDIQKVFDEAIRSAGSDLTDGALLWDTIREYELAILFGMDTSSGNFKSQVIKVFEIFRKELSIPLVHTKDILPNFKDFMSIMDIYVPNSEVVKQEIEDAHMNSKDILKQLLEFESDIMKFDNDETEKISEKCQAYLKYITFVKNLLDDNSLKDCNLVNFLGILYNRATSECIVPFYQGRASLPDCAENLCIDYIDYAREYGSDEYCLKIIEKVIRRYQRNSTLWILKLQHLERVGKDFDEIKTQFESALVGGFDTADNYVSLWLCYLEILRRRTDFSSTKEIEILRKTFRLSWDSLSEIWGDEADKEFVILQYWARIEYYRVKDYEYGENLFKEIMEYGDNNMRGGLWLEYMRLEFHRGGEDRARTVLKKAVKNSPDPRLQYAWLALERDFGTLDTLIECNKVCAAKSKEWAEIQAKTKANTYGKFQNKTYSAPKNQHNEETYKKGKNKRKQQQDSDENVSNKSLKTHHDDYPSSSDRPSIAKIKSNGVKSGAQETVYDEPKPNLKRKHDSFKDIHESPVKKLRDDSADRRTPFSLGDDTEKINRTVFISNLDFTVDEDKLREKLSEYGDIEELRLVTGVKSFGGSICYCIFLNNKSAQDAISHDRSLFNDRPMFISKYTEKGDRKKHFTYSTGMERNKLFVKNIPFEHCKDENLREIFQKYGDLKDVRIVTHKTGRPKGIAYVEFANDREASAAMKAVDGMEIDGRNLSVVISAPPPKKSIAQEIPTNPLRVHSRTKLFIPTVLQASTSASKLAPSKESSQTKMSNEDFRSMMLGKK